MADTEKDQVQSPLSFTQRMQKQATESQRILDEHRARLMSLIGARQQMPYDPGLMALARGLLAPTKTGSFGESAGYGLGAYSEEMERQFKRQQEEAKMAYDIELAAQEQKRKLMNQQMLTEFFGSQGEPLEGELPPAVPAVAKLEAPSTAAPAVPELAPTAAPKAPVVPGAEPEIVARAPEPKAAVEEVSVRAGYEKQLADLIKKINKQGTGAFSKISDEEIATMEAISPENAAIIKNYKEMKNKGMQLDISRVNALKDLLQLELNKEKAAREELSIEQTIPGLGLGKYSKKMIDKLDKLTEQGADINEVIKTMRSFNFEPKFTVGSDKKVRFMTPDEIEIEKEKAKERSKQTTNKYQIPEVGKGYYEIRPIDYGDYADARAKGPNALQLWFNQSQLFPGVKIKGSTIGNLGIPGGTVVEGAARPATEEELAASKTGAEETAKLEAKTAQEKKTFVIQMGDTARDRIVLANQLERFASDKKKNKVMAVLEKATPESALGKMLSEGISVGSFRVGLPQLREALIQAGGNANDVTNFQQLANIYTQLMFLNGNLFAGQGSVSNYEREMQQRMGGTVQDNPTVALARSQYIKTRANFDKAVSNMFQDWLENNPGGTYDKFKRKSAEYQRLEETYISRIEKIGQKYFPDLGTPSSPAAPAAPARSAPPSRSAPTTSPDRYLR